MRAIPKAEREAAFWAVVKVGYFCLENEEPRTVCYIVNTALRAAAKVREQRKHIPAKFKQKRFED